MHAHDRYNELNDIILDLYCYAHTIPGHTKIISPSKAAVSMTTAGRKKQQALHAAELRAKKCTRCTIAQTRKNVVYGIGSAEALLMFIGEAPGVQEDIQGIPFVGRAGQLLTKLLADIGFTREEIYIANVLKCHPHPPGNVNTNRAPMDDEVKNCASWLDEQIRIIAPRMICLLGNPALNRILGFTGITRHAGKVYDYNGVATMPIFHPSWALRNPNNLDQIRTCFKQLRHEYDTRFAQ